MYQNQGMWNGPLSGADTSSRGKRADVANVFSILFHPDYYRRPRPLTGSAVPDESGARGLPTFGRSPLGGYRRWGIAPRPENYCCRCFFPDRFKRPSVVRFVYFTIDTSPFSSATGKLISQAPGTQLFFSPHFS